MNTQTLNGFGLVARESGLAAMFAKVTAWLEEQRRFRRTMDELSRLSDRELDDIGLSRGRIQSVARECACAAS